MEPIFNAHSQAIWQSITPRELQGRVFSIARVAGPRGRLQQQRRGPRCRVLFDSGYVYAALGLVSVAVFCAAQLFNPYMLRVEDKAVLKNEERARS